MTASDVYGRMVGADDIGDAVVNEIRTRSDHYLAEKARQRGLPADALPPFASIDEAASAVLLPEHSYPACIVAVLGLDQPERFDGGWWSARWQVGVSVFVATGEYADLRVLVGMYAAAMRSLMVQSDLAGLARDVVMTGEAYDVATDDSGRNVGGATVVVDVHVDAVARDHVLLDPLPADPYAAPPVVPPVSQVDATVDHIDLVEDP